ncbi:MAG: peptidase M23, partial [Lachnospiraceae bacterium]|nr:peptidase M23 [Lachnospiraceae bacterium]
MIEVYSRDSTDYSKNGDITLFPESCMVAAELNGAWYMDLTHPIDEEGRWKYITEEAVIAAPTFMGKKQLFRIDDVEKTDTEITVKAYPIFFDSSDDCFLMDVRPTGKTGQQALNEMTAGSRYSGQSDITSGSTAYFVRRNLMDAINGEESPTFIERWGGEILYNNYTIVINRQVGADRGMEVR